MTYNLKQIVTFNFRLDRISMVQLQIQIYKPDGFLNWKINLHGKVCHIFQEVSPKSTLTLKLNHDQGH